MKTCDSCRWCRLVNGEKVCAYEPKLVKIGASPQLGFPPIPDDYEDVGACNMWAPETYKEP
jgi:hypothetical protein